MDNLPFPPEASFLSVKEVADLFRVCPKTVRRWIASDALPATRLGSHWRIHRDDLSRLAGEHGSRFLSAFL